jgi:RsiW-degrading membrane proteinase PrsW (M82 family)
MALDPALLARVPLALLPVCFFLAALLLLDSYKLVRLRTVLTVIALGGLAALASYLISGPVLAATGFELKQYSRYVAPLIEELLKGAVIIALIRTHRIGFLVDAAIFGVGVGAGFAMVENLWYLSLMPESHIAVWIVRGFGTAIMHGGVTAIFGVTALALVDQRGRADLMAFAPGLLLAAVVHSCFNHFFLSPILQTVGILLLLPPLLMLVFQKSERAVEDWLGVGFDADTELLELLNSGQFSQSPVGGFLDTLKRKFRGEVVADLVCYLRLHVELALKAKGVLMMREGGFEVEIDEPTRAKFEEMRYLERVVGTTALLAIKPFLHMSRKDLWQLYMLGK